MATTCTRRLEWDAGHRVLGHQGKCRHLHGHRYRADVTVRAPKLNDLGMVVDFGIIKERLGKWIDDNLDHNMILHIDDPLLMAEAEVMGNRFLIGQSNAEGVFAGRPPYVMAGNPTAENLAQVICQKAVLLLPEVEVVRVRVYETTNCWADYENK